jgi:hypothetical protein
MSLYLRVWHGEEFDWITLTPNNPDAEDDSSLFDEGHCTGFKIRCIDTPQFITRILRLMSQFNVVIIGES